MAAAVSSRPMKEVSGTGSGGNVRLAIETTTPDVAGWNGRCDGSGVVAPSR